MFRLFADVEHVLADVLLVNVSLVVERRLYGANEPLQSAFSLDPLLVFVEIYTESKEFIPSSSSLDSCLLPTTLLRKFLGWR